MTDIVSVNCKSKTARYSIWDHTVLHVTWCRWTHPSLVLSLPTPEGWKA